jgi:hypothetical protein
MQKNDENGCENARSKWKNAEKGEEKSLFFEGKIGAKW